MTINELLRECMDDPKIIGIQLPLLNSREILWTRQVPIMVDLN